jgi:hypothetical protein
MPVDPMPVRLIVHTDSIKKPDVNTFASAAMSLESEYRKLYAKDSIRRIFVRTGHDIVRAINDEMPNAIASLDVVSHGNQSGVHIARKLAKPVKSGFLQRRLHYRVRLRSDRPQTKEDAEFCEESMHGLYTDWTALEGVGVYYNQVDGGRADVAYLSDIKYGRFQEGAHVELHGCLTAEMIPVVNQLKDNFTKQLSDNLPKGSTVVGHITRSNPNSAPSSRISDYRHGAVRVYRDGGIIMDSVERSTQKFPGSSTPR